MREFSQPVAPALTRTSPIARTLAKPLTLCVVTIAAVMPALLSTPPHTRRVALPMFLAGAAISLGVGLYGLAKDQDRRFARVLLAGGLLWSVSALAGSSASAAYSLGRVCQWLVELAVVYLLLSYPSGRLTGPVQSWLFGSAALLVAVFYLPTALLVQQYPNPSAWSMCTSGCPHNAFALTNSTLAAVPNAVVPFRESVTFSLLVVVSGLAIQRARNSGALLGRMCTPMALIAVVQAVCFGVYFRARAVTPMASGLDVLSWIYVLSLPAVALAAASGRLYRRLFATKALDRIALELRMGGDRAQIGRVMAEALEDPSLRILHSFPGDWAWVDESGAPVALSPDRTEHDVTEVASGDWRIAILHDPALSGDSGLIEAAGTYALAALENDRLSSELHSSREQLTQARVLGVDAERRERRKIERDIHDGAQQHLVALRIKLALAADQIGSHDPGGAAVLRALEEDVDATIEEVRSFARGIYPQLLGETGLRGALQMLGSGTGLPTTVEAEGLGRYSRQIETTIYFSCSEALQNAVKHGHGATCVTVRVWQERGLNFEVRDNGSGFDPRGQEYGTGLFNLRERLAAVGGSLRVRSAPGQGTTIAGTIPTSAPELLRPTPGP